MWIGRTILELNRNTRIGEIVLLDFPYTNQAGPKVRPGVIISQSSTGTGDVTVAYITSEVDHYTSGSLRTTATPGIKMPIMGCINPVN
jgi:hypothetical protein